MPFNSGCIIAFVACLLFWAVLIWVAVVLTDWFVVGCVIALVIAVYLAIGNMIDNMIDYWRAGKGEE